ncbi:hypothetical protein H6F95_10420 [Cyanobacteria bacterium FACHB-471]|nr:hypothetical protein [Cyanobacteria bacterium FACHB-471]
MSRYNEELSRRTKVFRAATKGLSRRNEGAGDRGDALSRYEVPNHPL